MGASVRIYNVPYIKGAPTYVWHVNLVLEPVLHAFVLFCPCIRGRRVLENRQSADDEKIEQLEDLLKVATEAANEAERKYDEVGLTEVLLCVLHDALAGWRKLQYMYGA